MQMKSMLPASWPICTAGLWVAHGGGGGGRGGCAHAEESMASAGQTGAVHLLCAAAGLIDKAQKYYISTTDEKGTFGVECRNVGQMNYFYFFFIIF